MLLICFLVLCLAGAGPGYELELTNEFPEIPTYQVEVIETAADAFAYMASEQGNQVYAHIRETQDRYKWILGNVTFGDAERFIWPAGQRVFLSLGTREIEAAEVFVTTPGPADKLGRVVDLAGGVNLAPENFAIEFPGGTYHPVYIAFSRGNWTLDDAMAVTLGGGTNDAETSSDPGASAVRALASAAE